MRARIPQFGLLQNLYKDINAKNEKEVCIYIHTYACIHSLKRKTERKKERERERERKKKREREREGEIDR